MSAIVSSPCAHRLAWCDGREYHTSEYGYLRAEAAARAAPTLNHVRLARGKPVYSHVAAFEGSDLKAIQTLEAAS